MGVKLKKEDLAGQVFGRLTVIGPTENKDKHQRYIWHTVCECGNDAFMIPNNFLTGNTRSCGCLERDTLVAKNIARTKSGYQSRINPQPPSERDKEVRRKAAKKFRDTPKGKLAALKSQKRRHDAGRPTERIRRKLRLAQDNKCNLCSKNLVGVQTHIDHILALSRNGKTVMANMQLLCALCNMRKGSKNNEEYLEYLPHSWRA